MATVMEPELKNLLIEKGLKDNDCDTLLTRDIATNNDLAFLVDSPEKFRDNIGNIPGWALLTKNLDLSSDLANTPVAKAAVPSPHPLQFRTVSDYFGLLQ